MDEHTHTHPTPPTVDPWSIVNSLQRDKVRLQAEVAWYRMFLAGIGDMATTAANTEH